MTVLKVLVESRAVSQQPLAASFRTLHHAVLTRLLLRLRAAVSGAAAEPTAPPQTTSLRCGCCSNGTLPTAANLRC